MISAVLNLRGLGTFFFFFFLSQLFRNDTISLVIWQELICMTEAFSWKKLAVYFIMLSCFSSGIFSRCKERKMAKSNWYSRIPPSLLNVAIKCASLQLFKVPLYVVERYV